jgi:AbrB family looped-hinge helix DNA binding protein
MTIRITYHNQEVPAMKELFTVVTKKGQITLPVEIRRSLGIKQGDKIAVALVAGEPSQVLLKPVHSVAELTFGAVTPRKRPEDFKELRREFEEGVAEEVVAEAPPRTHDHPLP